MLIKKMIAAEYAKYMLQLKSELNYFKIPLSIENIKQLIKDKINEIESNLLDSLLSMGLSLLASESFINFIKQTDDHRTITKNINNSYNESEINELLIKCSSVKIDDSVEVNKIQQEIYDIASSNNLLEDGVFTLSSLLSIGSLINEIFNNSIKEYTILKSSLQSYIIIFKETLNKIKNLLKSRYPSKYLLKRIMHSLQTLINTEIISFNNSIDALYKKYSLLLSNTYNDILKQIENIKTNITNIINNVNNFINNIKTYSKLFKSLLTSLSIASFTYITNAYFVKKRSKESFKDNVVNSLCINDIDDYIYNNDASYKNPDKKIISSLIVDNLSCNNSEPEYIIPSKPILGNEEYTCDTKQSEKSEEFSEFVDTSNDAIIINHLPDIFTINISINSNIKAGDILGYVNNIPIFSPISGYIDKIEYNRIYITNINEEEGNIKLNIIEEYQNLITRKNSINAFLGRFKGLSYFPIYLYGTNKKNKATGLKSAFKNVLDDIIKYKNSYNKSIEKICSADNIKVLANNEKLSVINDTIKSETEKYIKNINLRINKTNDLCKILKAKDIEYNLFYYYFDLYHQLINDTDNNISEELANIIKPFYEKRYKIEKISRDNIKDMINESVPKEGKSNKWFNRLLESYNNKYLISDVDTTLSGLLLKTKLSEEEKNICKNEVIELFKYYINNNITEKNNDIHLNDLINEVEQISAYLNKIDLEYKTIDKTIFNAEIKIEYLSYIQPYYIENIDNIDYRIYAIDIIKEDECDTDDINNMAKSKFSINTINYWLKYCSIATGIGCINIASWSTGIILPTGPVKMPIVYLPFKVINTDFGQIVIGLSICGIAITPLIIGVNFSYLLNCIMGDPTKPIKAEINEFKKQVNNLKGTFKNITLKPILKSLNNDINDSEKNINNIKLDIEQLKKNKPKKTSYSNKILYNKDLYKWTASYTQNREKLYNEYLKLYTYKSKHYIITLFINSDKTPNKLKDAPEVKIIENNNKIIDNALNSIKILQDTINKFLLPLPITMMEDSINFGPGLKNFMPVNKIDDNMSQSINTSLLEKILDKYSMKNEQFMSSNINKEVSNSVLNTNKFKKYIKTQMSSLTIKDDIPKYENLNITNIKWLFYLNTQFLLKGGSIYGLPV